MCRAAIVHTSLSASVKKLATLATVFTAIAAAAIMWEDLRPYATREEAQDAARRACENTAARLRQQIYQAQANEYDAAKRGDDKVVLQARRAQQELQADLDGEMRDCGFE